MASVGNASRNGKQNDIRKIYSVKMAFVHPQSCECIKSELDIFAVPPTQTSREHGQYVEYNLIAAIALGQPIEFNISGGGQDYLDLANTQLYVKAQILRHNGNALADVDDVGR